MSTLKPLCAIALSIACVLAVVLPGTSASLPEPERLHQAIAAFIADELERFEINEPLPCGTVSVAGLYSRRLIQMTGGLNLELSSPRRISVDSVLVDLNAKGETSGPQIKLSVLAFGVVVTGQHDIEGHVAYNETIGGPDGGSFTIIPPMSNPLNATCSLKVDTSPEGYLQLGSCYLTTGTISLNISSGGTYVHYNPRLVNAPSLEADVQEVTLRRAESVATQSATLAGRLGSGLMAAVVSHLQESFNRLKILDMLAATRPRYQTTNHHLYDDVEAGAFPSYQGQPGTIQSKLEAFTTVLILNFTQTPVFDPYAPGSGATLSFTRPLLKLQGAISNVTYAGFARNTLVDVEACYECAKLVLNTHIDVPGGELSGNYAFSGHVTPALQFSSEGTFLLENVTARIWLKVNMDVVEGRFVPTSTNMLWSDFQVGGAKSNFNPGLLDAIDGEVLDQEAKYYVDELVVEMMANQLDSFVAQIRGMFNSEIQRVLRATMAIDVLI